MTTRTTPFVPLMTTVTVGDKDGEHYTFIIKSDDNLVGTSRWDEYDEMLRDELMNGMVELVAKRILLLDSKLGVIKGKTGREFFRMEDWNSKFAKLSEYEKEMYRFFDYREMAKRDSQRVN